MKTLKLTRLLLGLAAGAALLAAGNAVQGQTLTTSWTNKFDTAPDSAGYAWWYDMYQQAYSFGYQLPITNSWASDKNQTSGPPPVSGAGSGALAFYSYWPGVPQNSGKGGQNLIIGAFGGGNPFDFSKTIDATKYESISFDLYVDPASPTNSAGNVCSLTVGFVLNNYSTYTVSNVIVPVSNMGTWVRYTCFINPSTAPTPPGALAAGPMFNINCYGGQNANLFTNTIPTKMWIDNYYLKLSPFVAPPPKLATTIGNPLPGLNLFSAQPASDQYQRNSVKLNQRFGTGWLGQGGMSYSMTITNFPDGTKFPGYQAHLFLTTGPGTASALDYNETNVIWFNVSANADNSANITLRYKINEPFANTNMFGAEYIGLDPTTNSSAGTLINLYASSVLGTFTLTFNDDTNVTITGPGGASANLTLRPEVAAPFTEPINVVVGGQPNQPANVGQDVVIASINVTNSGQGFPIVSEDFIADGSLNTVNWSILTGEPNTVFVFPYDPGQRVVSWTTPDTGFALEVATNLSAPINWTIVTGADSTQSPALTTWSTGGARFALVPSSVLAPNQDYFRLYAHKFTKLQVLLPGEIAAPGTPTGKSGTPDPQNAGTPFNVIVNAVDANWNPAIYNSDHNLHFTSTDTAATLPANTQLVNGTVTVSVTLNTSGTWTITSSDVTDATKTSNTSSAVTIP
jgi:hypothetical protein